MGDKLLLKFGTKFQLTSHVKLQNYHYDGNVWHQTSQYNITNQMPTHCKHNDICHQQNYKVMITHHSFHSFHSLSYYGDE